jgi:FkbH-like protein
MSADLEAVRQHRTRAEVLGWLGARRTPLPLAQVRALTRHVQSLGEAATPLRLAVLHTYTTELLRPYWQFESALQGFELQLYEAPYGALLSEAEPGSSLVAADPQLILVFMRLEDLDPRLGAPVSGLPADGFDEVLDRAVSAVGGLVRKLRQVTSATVVLTFLPALWGPELGQFDPMATQSDSELRRRLKWAVSRDMAALPSVLFCDLDEAVMDVGRLHFFDLRLWETSRFPFSVAGAQDVVRRLLSYAVVQLQTKAKCIVVDADNTLWGGIIGEDGPTGIKLGPDHPGSAYLAFQRRLLAMQQRGFLLALCSKNNPQDVAEVLAEHPHQVLRAEHFAAMRVNWASKAENLRELAKELNLGVDSFVFVDDSAHECHAVRQQVPEVTVVQVPADPVQIPYCLDAVARLEILSLTGEDRDRTQMYTQDRLRRSTADSYSNFDDYLASLNMVMRVGVDAEAHVARIAQLTQKTNQFNLTTRRYTEAEVLEFMRDPDALVAHFSLEDIFGDSGLVGVAIVRRVTSSEAAWDTLLMSCRVIGRRAEQAFVRTVVNRLAERGVGRIVSTYVPTAKNEMVRNFWPTVGFVPVDASAAETTYAVDVPLAATEAPLPIQIVDATGR